MSSVKSYEITKQSVWDAYERVKTNGGAAGVDGQTIAMFEENLKDNLYKIWNRMSSGSYFPPAVRFVEIPKRTSVKINPVWDTGKLNREIFNLFFIFRLAISQR